MIIRAKILTIGLPWAIAAFGVATAVLAIQNAKLNRDIREIKETLDVLEEELVNANKPPQSLEPTVAPGPDEPENMNFYRLPGDLLPEHYNLFLDPDIATGDFSGKVQIQIKVIQTTRTIILHSNKLNISEVHVTDGTSRSINVVHYELEALREFLIVDVDTELVLGRSITLSITYSGRMQNKIVGLYSSTYTKPDGLQKAIATSKFEPTYARQAFPCFDEPAMKATFSVTLVHPVDGDYHALSNMNAFRTTQDDLHAETHFAESVPMSTYLTCFIVSDLKFESKRVHTNGIGSDFDVRVFATSHQLSKVNFALDSAIAVSEFFIQYFGIEYPLPKLDMAAIPDFVSNAMEHWGLLTYRESVLLYDPDMSSATNIQKIATVVAHELAHMWFGNLVTMMWWNDLWLNEGFARYMEYKSIDQIYPDWHMSDQFIIHAVHSVMKYDSSVASHPIVQTVSNPDQITEIFDTISYEKGASVIRMLEDFVGGENFRKAVTNYLNKFKYSNAVTDDFLTEIEALGLDFDVKKVMRTWTEQMGLPVVEVQKVSETKYKLKQKRFLSNPEDYGTIYNDSPFNYTWEIPITYVTSESSKVQRVWLEHDVQEISIEVSSGVKWIKLNDKQVGYYRVNYHTNIWRTIIAELVANPERFSIANRAHLLNDAFALADASQLSYDIALDMTTYLRQESDYVPWSVASTKLMALQNILRYTDVYKDYLAYNRDLVRQAYKTVTWTVGQDHVRNRFRVTILTLACSLGLPDCLAEASVRLTSWLSNPTERPVPDLREIVYYYGMQTVGTEKLWNEMWDVFQAELDASEKTKLMYGLAGIQSPWILHKFVELAWSNVRQQDYFSCLQNIAANSVGESVVWDYVRENWERMVQRFGLNERVLGRMIPSITERFSTATKLEEMEIFFKEYPDAGAGTASRKQALETVKNNIKWLEENKDGVAEWLKNH